MNQIDCYLSLLKKKDYNTYIHSRRVAYYSFLIAKELGYNQKNVLHIVRCALLHDIGKLYIPNEILLNNRRLTKEEYESIKKHVIYSTIILQKDFPDLIEDISMHHERINGNGYPNNLKDISLSAQIIGLTDSFDAMTSNRGYNKVLSFDEAFLELFRCSIEDKSYDQELIKIFSYSLKKQKRDKISISS